MEASQATPAIVVSTSDDRSRTVLHEELTRRYGGDYQVECRSAADEAMSVLARFAEIGVPVALVISVYGPDDRTGIEFLTESRALHPTAYRCVIVVWGDFASAPEVFAALANGQVDLSLVRPEQRRDEEFHGAVTDALEDWHLARGEGFEAVRIIGEHWSPRCTELRDTFTRNHIPIRFLRQPTPTVGRQAARRPRPRPIRRCPSWCSCSPPSRPCSRTRPTSRSPTRSAHDAGLARRAVRRGHRRRRSGRPRRRRVRRVRGAAARWSSSSRRSGVRPGRRR